MIDTALFGIPALGIPALAATGLALGARHALDADHLAIVDAVARRDAFRRPWRARLAGALFALGHVLIVIAAAILACLFLDREVAPPGWLSVTGVAISAAMLLTLGLANLRAALRHSPGSPTPVVGWRSRWMPSPDRSALIVLTGALLAVSFDTMAIALALGLAGKLLGGWAFALFACLSFAFGMAAVGTANGAFTVHLLRAADDRAAVVSRAMTWAIGLVNVGLGLLGGAALLLPALDGWREENGSAASITVVAVCVAAFLVSGVAGRAGPIRSSPAARG